MQWELTQLSPAGWRMHRPPDFLSSLAQRMQRKIHVCYCGTRHLQESLWGYGDVTWELLSMGFRAEDHDNKSSCLLSAL